MLRCSSTNCKKYMHGVLKKILLRDRDEMKQERQFDSNNLVRQLLCSCEKRPEKQNAHFVDLVTINRMLHSFAVFSDTAVVTHEYKDNNNSTKKIDNSDFLVMEETSLQ